MKKKKLELKKKVIASLSDGQKAKIIGGDDTDATYADCPTQQETDCGENSCNGACDTATCITACAPDTCNTTCC